MVRVRSPSETTVRLAVLVLSLACVGISLLFVLSPLSDPTVAAHWRVESVVMICLLAALSGGLFVSRSRVLSMVLLLFRMAIILVVTVPFGGSLVMKIPLWASVVIESCGSGDLPVTLVLLCLFLASVFFSHGPVLIWGDTTAGAPPPVELAAAAVSLGGLAALVLLLRSGVAAGRRKDEQMGRLDEAVRQLTAANLSFQKIASTAQERSAEDERKRITREIHDAIGYALTNLIMMMEAAMRLSPADGAPLRSLLGQAREEAQTGLNETRRALRLLRTVAQERVSGLTAVHRLVGLFSSATGVEVRVDYCNADQGFGDETDLAVYRMVQEGMTNAFRHGHATLIRLQFWQEPAGLRVKLWDNGTAEAGFTEGLGLAGMRERIERAGGTLQAGRVADGFELLARIPLPDTTPQADSVRLPRPAEEAAHVRP